MFPATIANFLNVKEIPWLQFIVNALSPGHIIYIAIYVAFIFFFCYFYTAVHFNPVDVADNMKKYGGFIPGIRPGKNTAEYIDRVLTRITFTGAVYVSAVCILPQILIYKMNVPFYFEGHGSSHCGGRGHGHDEPNRVSHAHPALRGIHEKGLR